MTGNTTIEQLMAAARSGPDQLRKRIERYHHDADVADIVTPEQFRQLAIDAARYDEQKPKVVTLKRNDTDA